jgi:hypothetical protein
MSNYILAGVGTIEAFTQSSTQPTKIFTSKTLQESGISISVTAEDIRGGLSNPLLGRYFHDSILEANITDALFNLQYLALNVGGEVVIGGSSLVTETVTAGSGTLTVQGTPVAFGTAGTVGWYTPAGQEDWAPLTFEGKVATATVTSGTDYCVRYNANDAGIQEFVVPSAIIPSEVHLVMTYPLFAGGTSPEAISTSSQVGELIVDIPRFQFAGNVELSLTSSGAATSNLSGSALASYTTANCNDMGTYGTVKQKIYGGNWYDDLTTIAVDGGNFSIANGATKKLKVIGIFKNGTGVLDNSKLTFTSSASSTASVTNAGVVTGAGTGSANITITVTDKTSVATMVGVTVTA